MKGTLLSDAEQTPCGVTHSYLHAHANSESADHFKSDDAAEWDAFSNGKEQTCADSHEEGPNNEERDVSTSLANEDANDGAGNDEREDQAKEVKSRLGGRVIPDDLEGDWEVIGRDEEDPPSGDLGERDGRE